MPLFFIDVYDGDVVVRDWDGIDLDSVEEAAEQATALLPDLARDALPDRESRDFAALVRDEEHTVVYRAALLFRGQRAVDRAEPRSGTRPEAEDLILRSRATRDAARRVSARLQDDVRALLDLVQQGLLLVDEAKASLRAEGRNDADHRSSERPRLAPEGDGVPEGLGLTPEIGFPDR